MDFVAIDFETANEKRTSACSIGIVVVKNGKIVNTEHVFFKPVPYYFTNSWIHGIDENDVKNELSFSEKWESIKHYFSDSLILAHNASFDLSVLRQVLSNSKISYPKIRYVCTYRLSEKIISNLPNYKLSSLANYFDLELKHHEALSDSIVCAQIGIRLLNIKNHSCLLKLSESEDFQVGELKANFRYDSFSKKKKRKIFKKNRYGLENITVISNSLEGAKIVVSGILHQNSRADYKKMIKEHGGKNVNSISKNTTFVLVGENMGPSKKKKAEDFNIPLVNEVEFLTKLN